MNIHEFQAKELFAAYGLTIPHGVAATTREEIEQGLDGFPSGKIVVKAQIHAGGRGKGTFTDGYKGGVKVCASKDEAREAAQRMLGNTLVTHQTGPAGREVRTVYLTAASDIDHEFYLAMLLDRETSRPVLIASREGGVEIEKVAEENPEAIVKASIDPVVGIRPYLVRSVAQTLQLNKEQTKQLGKMLTGLYRLFWEKDASLVEINPLITTPDGDLVALDAKVNFDDNALFRQDDIKALRDLHEEDPKEVEASKFALNYIALDGNIACMVNGAGLAMATMDIIKHYGGNPANFLDVGGGANEEQVTAAFQIILSDTNVEGILVNIFGGIMQCDIIAKGIITAAKKVDLDRPLVVRLEGTNVKEGKELLAASGLALEPADSLAEAAQKIVKLVQKAA